MDRYFSAFSGASPAAGDLRTQFLRIITLSLICSMISSLSIIIALPSALATNVDGRAAVANSSDLEASSSNHVGLQTDHHHGHHERSQMSNYVRASLQRQQQQQQQRKNLGGKREDRGNLRKLSSDSGCLSNPTMCDAMPGWTSASLASTCCATSGFCTDIQFDWFNCGACGEPCEWGYSCCSGQCVALFTDPNNCGACGNVCQGEVCTFGFCEY